MVSAKRGSQRRRSARKTSRLSKNPAQPHRLTAEEVRRVVIPRPASLSKEPPLVALFDDVPVVARPSRVFGGITPTKSMSSKEMQVRLPGEVRSVLPGVPTKAPRGLNREGLGNDPFLGQAWTQVLRLFPATIRRLGIESEVLDWSFARRWLGSGAFATAFAMPNPLRVLKLTTDAEDAYVLEKISEEPRNLPGILRVYEVFRAELPFAVGQTYKDTMLPQAVSTVYGAVTERVLTLGDFEVQTNVEPLQDLAAAHFGSQLKAARAIVEAVQGARAALRAYRQGLDGDELAAVSEYARDLVEGSSWCEAHDINYFTDLHEGNFALAWRGGRFVLVKSDLGYNSVAQGVHYARSAVSRLPLAANRRRSRGRS